MIFSDDLLCPDYFCTAWTQWEYCEQINTSYQAVLILCRLRFSQLVSTASSTHSALFQLLSTSTDQAVSHYSCVVQQGRSFRLSSLEQSSPPTEIVFPNTTPQAGSELHLSTFTTSTSRTPLVSLLSFCLSHTGTDSCSRSDRLGSTFRDFHPCDSLKGYVDHYFNYLDVQFYHWPCDARYVSINHVWNILLLRCICCSSFRVHLLLYS